MKDQIFESLGYVLDEKTVAFFAVILSKQDNGEIIPTITEFGELTDEWREKLSLGLMEMAAMISRSLPLPTKRLDDVNQVIRSYVLIQQEKDPWKLARWYSTLSEYKWPLDLPGKPEGFDQLPDAIQGEPYQWNHYGSKAFYTYFLCQLIIQKIGVKKTLQYHHLHNLKRSRLQFELWWLKQLVRGELP